MDFEKGKIRLKTHIFFDTNILEIPKGKDFSRFQFSGEYQKVIDFIKEYSLQNEISILIPKIVLDELLKHYKQEYKDMSDSVEKEINKINNEFGTVLNELQPFCPKYNKSEYYDFIEKSMIEYIDSLENITIQPYPKEIDPIIKRAIDNKKPFVSRKINGKDHKDGGFKDAIIWETILRTIFKNDDYVILFTEDPDFEESILKKEISNSFRVISNFSTLKEIIIDIHDINDPLYKILKVAKSDYFIENLIKGIKDHLQYQLDEENIELKEINIQRNEIKVTQAKYNEAYEMIEWDYGKGYFDMHLYDEHGDEFTEEYLKVTIPVEFIYKENDSGSFFKSKNCIECISDLVEIRSYVYPAYLLEKNREIIDYEKQ